jgi:hypothetical protein
LKAQFDQQLVSSFYLWFENRLLDPSIHAYQTGVSNSYQYIETHDVPSTHVAYQGQYRQLAAEYDIDVPNSGIFVNGGFVSGGQAGVYTDYNNGRVIFPVASGQSLAVTSVSSVKEVNTYLSNDNPEQILLESDFFADGELVPNLSNQPSKLDENTFFLPACFIFPSVSENKEFCFGGEEDTQNHFRVMVLAKDNFTLDAILSAFRDGARKCIPLIDFEDFPYGEFFSIKNFPYRYSDLSATSTQTAFIEKIKASRIGGGVDQGKLDRKTFRIGFLDFDISTYRFPRS